MRRGAPWCARKGRGPAAISPFVVIADQHPPLDLKIFVSERGLAAWRAAHGRELDPNELYATAKMRLFRGFDEHESLADERLNLIVDETNILELLETLGVE